MSRVSSDQEHVALAYPQPLKMVHGLVYVVALWTNIEAVAVYYFLGKLHASTIKAMSSSIVLVQQFFSFIFEYPIMDSAEQMDVRYYIELY